MVVDLQQRFQQHAALRAEADERDVDLAVRRIWCGRLAESFRAGGQQQARAGGGGGADEFAAGMMRVGVYHFLSSANLLCLASIRANATSATWMPSQEMPSSCLIKIKPDRQRDVNQALHEQRQPRAQAEQQHHAGDDERRAEQMIKRRERGMRQQRFVGELVLERRGNARIIGQRVVFHLHVNHRAAGVLHAGGRDQSAVSGWSCRRRIFRRR